MRSESTVSDPRGNGYVNSSAPLCRGVPSLDSRYHLPVNVLSGNVLDGRSKEMGKLAPNSSHLCSSPMDQSCQHMMKPEPSGGASPPVTYDSSPTTPATIHRMNPFEHPVSHGPLSSNINGCHEDISNASGDAQEDAVAGFTSFGHSDALAVHNVALADEFEQRGAHEYSLLGYENCGPSQHVSQAVSLMAQHYPHNQICQRTQGGSNLGHQNHLMQSDAGMYDDRLSYSGMSLNLSGVSDGPSRSYNSDVLISHKAVAFLAGPRERIHVFGNPVECCPRCIAEGLGNVGWRPHRHIGELKVRYICERNFDDLESPHHFDIPLCPLCGQVLYLYEFNGMLGVGSARRLHKYVLKCATRHILPLLDIFCQTKKGGEKCNSNFKLQWSYGTMVKRCASQKNRDHDLWWVRYKNEWKQRRTIIRYKKDFLRHLADVQRAVLLGLGTEGEAPPDPKYVLGPTYDALVAAAGGAPASPKIKKRRGEQLCKGDEFLLDGDEANSKRRRLEHTIYRSVPPHHHDGVDFVAYNHLDLANETADFKY